MANVKVKGPVNAVKRLLSGDGGARVNSGSPPSRETVNKQRQFLGNAPKRKSMGAFLADNQTTTKF